MDLIALGLISAWEGFICSVNNCRANKGYLLELISTGIDKCSVKKCSVNKG